MVQYGFSHLFGWNRGELLNKTGNFEQNRIHLFSDFLDDTDDKFPRRFNSVQMLMLIVEIQSAKGSCQGGSQCYTNFPHNNKIQKKSTLHLTISFIQIKSYYFFFLYFALQVILAPSHQDNVIRGMEIVIGNQFKILKKVGAGSFGEIYEAVSIKRGNKVAVKLESIGQKYQQLLYEAQIMSSLLNCETVTDKGIPYLHAYGKEGEFNYLVMDLLGMSLEQMFQRQDCRFSLKTTLMVAEQMIKRIQYLHSQGYVHRDVKPENFLTSGSKDKKIYLIDFGLSKKYKKDGKHIGYEDGKSMVGTIRYASLNTHYGIEITRRDDVESLFFCWCYFLMGELPWQSMKAPSRKEKYERIMGKKQQYRPELLCKNLPVEFVAIMTHIRSLKFEEKPNYELIKNEIRKCMRENNIQYDYRYDWDPPSHKILSL